MATLADVFKAYVKPTLKGRVILRKRTANRKSHKVILYNSWVAMCSANKEVSPAGLAKKYCIAKYGNRCKENYDYYRTALRQVLRAIRAYFVANGGCNATSPSSVSCWHEDKTFTEKGLEQFIETYSKMETQCK